MKKYFKIISLYFLCFGLIILFNGCAAGLALGEAEGLAAALGEVEAGSALAVGTESVLIADEAMLDGVLDRVFIEGDELYVRTTSGTTRAIGEVTGRNTAFINKFKNVEMPGDIYRVKGNGVKVRSSASSVNDYNVFEHRNTGQIVLKLEERNGWAYVELGNHQYGWMSLAYLGLVSNKNTSYTTHPQYQKCAVCKGTGHSVQNVNCTLCHGTGKIVCGYCSGQGKNKCYQCNGQGKKKCNQCNGYGSSTCSRCFGNGYNVDGFGNKTICTYCSGNKTIQCYYCNAAGSLNCVDCNGTGSISCTYCQSSGKSVCYQCFRKGSLWEDIQCRKCLGSGRIQIYH